MGTICDHWPLSITSFNKFQSMVIEVQLATHLTVNWQSWNSKSFIFTRKTDYFFNRNENFKIPKGWALSATISLLVYQVSTKSIQRLLRYCWPHIWQWNDRVQTRKTAIFSLKIKILKFRKAGPHLEMLVFQYIQFQQNP